MLVCVSSLPICSIILIVFLFILVLTNISSDSGSVEGGTILTINGDYFSQSSEYPLVVNVGEEPCTILSTDLATIQCQTSTMSVNNRNYYHGKSINEGNKLLYNPL